MHIFPKHLINSLLMLLLASIMGLAQKPELVVQTGHPGWSFPVEFSPDGKILATCGDDGVSLWDVVTGTQLYKFSGSSPLRFSHDGKLLAHVDFSADDVKVVFRDTTTGKELRAISGNYSTLVSIAFSPNDKLLAVSGWGDNKMIVFWDVSTGKEVRSLNIHEGLIAFSSDGRSIICTDYGFETKDFVIRFRDATTGEELRNFSKRLEGITAMAMSRDGKFFASAGGGEDNTIKVLDVTSGKELRVLPEHINLSSIKAILFLLLSPDGKILVSVSIDSIILWEVSTGKKLQSFPIINNLRPPVFSSDSNVLAVSQVGRITLLDVNTGKEIRILKGHSATIDAIAISPDGKTLASGSGGVAKLWDFTGRELRSLDSQTSLIRSLAFNRDGKILAAGTLEKIIKLWNTDTGAEIHTLTGHNSYITSISFSQDGRTLASASGDKTIKLWDVSTGKEVRTLVGHSGAIWSISFNPDGKTLASASQDKTVRLWDVSTGKQLYSLAGFSPVSFSPDGKTLISNSHEQPFGMKLWDVATGKEIRKLTETIVAVSIWSTVFSPNGKTLAGGTVFGPIKLLDASTGKELNTLTGHSGPVFSVAFSPDGKILASGSLDGTVKLWDVQSGKELVSLIAIDNQDWIAITPDGLFDGSPSAWRHILWRLSSDITNVAPVEIFFRDFYYPNLLADIMTGARPTAPKSITKIDRRQPQIKLTTASSQSISKTSTTARNIDVVIEVTEATPSKDYKIGGGAQDVRLFRNGSLVKVWHGDVLKGQSNVTLAASVPIIAGENHLTAYAFNRDNIKSADVTLTVTGADSIKRKGKVYILGIGINQYANPQYNLKYAVADVQAFAEELKRQQEKLNAYERVEIISLLDREATKENILRDLAQLQSKVQPEDMVVVYYAGHGTAYQNRFYLIPHDLGYSGSRTNLNQAAIDAILAHSISDRNLEQAFEKIDAAQIMLIIDACNSGQALEAEEKRRGPMNSKGLAQLAYEKGMYILTAAQSYQAALEAAQLGHGLLTYALVEEGLKKEKADKEPHDGQVLVREWFNYVTERVPQMQEEQMKRARGLGFDLAFVEGEERTLELERRNLQRPRLFYRRELEAQPLIVAKSGIVQPKQ